MTERQGLSQNNRWLAMCLPKKLLASSKTVVATRLVEPLVVFEAEDLCGVRVAHGLRRRLTRFVLGLAGQVIDEFLVGDLADRVAVPRLMRLANCDLAVAGVGRGFEPFLDGIDELLQI